MKEDERVEIMEIHVHIHHHCSALESKLESKIDLVLKNQGVMMAKVDELKSELVELNSTTNELAADVDDMLSKIGTGMTDAQADEVKAQLVELKTKLQGAAAKWTPDTPV